MNRTICRVEHGHFRRHLILEVIVSYVDVLYQKEKNVTVVILCLFCANIERWTYQFQMQLKNEITTEATEATEVSGRFGLIKDLRAEDAIYHKTCNSNFQTLKGKPTSKPFDIKTTYPERGRRSNAIQEAVFNEVVKYLQENDDKQITISELTEMMGKLCVDLKMACSKVWMKQKLLDRFGDDIMIGNINGKEDVVTFIFNAKKILAEFYDTIDSSSENVEEQKQRIIETAAKFIKNDVKSLPSSKTYPSMNEFQSIDNCIEYLTPSLKSLLKTMFVSNDKDKRVVFIGQATMQQIRPRALLIPLQVAVSVSLHHQFASRFIIDFLNAMGFGSSFSEVTKFEQNAAMSSKETGIFEKLTQLRLFSSWLTTLITIFGHLLWHGYHSCVNSTDKSGSFCRTC